MFTHQAAKIQGPLMLYDSLYLDYPPRHARNLHKHYNLGWKGEGEGESEEADHLIQSGERDGGHSLGTGRDEGRKGRGWGTATPIFPRLQANHFPVGQIGRYILPSRDNSLPNCSWATINVNFDQLYCKKLAGTDEIQLSIYLAEDTFWLQVPISTWKKSSHTNRPSLCGSKSRGWFHRENKDK